MELGWNCDGMGMELGWNWHGIRMELGWNWDGVDMELGWNWDSLVPPAASELWPQCLGTLATAPSACCAWRGNFRS